MDKNGNQLYQLRTSQMRFITGK